MSWDCKLSMICTLTHQQQDRGTKIHQRLDLILVEWVLRRIRMVVVATLAFPRLIRPATDGDGQSCDVI